MTVRAIVPIIDYTGDGTTVKYDYGWDMIEDSAINVLVNNEYVTNWSEQDQSVVFDTAPASGDEIIIFRRTPVWMPENYQAFGRFHSEKTELSVDRAIMIAQERAGDRGNGNAANGIVGGANLHISRQPYTITLHSERGSDAVLPMYNADDTVTPDPTPDATIIWDGDAIAGGAYSTDPLAATLRFKMNLVGGDPTEASAFYPNYNATVYAGWLDGVPADDAYWMRVRFPGSIPPSYPYIISDGATARSANEAFLIRAVQPNPVGVITDRGGNIIVDRAAEYIFPRGAPEYEDGTYGPYVQVNTFGLTPPITATATFYIDICKDDNGVPDDAWVTRTVTLEAIYNA